MRLRDKALSLTSDLAAAAGVSNVERVVSLRPDGRRSSTQHGVEIAKIRRERSHSAAGNPAHRLRSGRRWVELVVAEYEHGATREIPTTDDMARRAGERRQSSGLDSRRAQEEQAPSAHRVIAEWDMEPHHGAIGPGLVLEAGDDVRDEPLAIVDRIRHVREAHRVIARDRLTFPTFGSTFAARMRHSSAGLAWGNVGDSRLAGRATTRANHVPGSGEAITMPIGAAAHVTGRRGYIARAEVAMDDGADDLDEEFPLGDGTADTDGTVLCPYCGEANAIALDPGSGARQEYVEDCQVCCQPWRLSVRYLADGTASVHAEALDDE